jgi:hypothetical protein
VVEYAAGDSVQGPEAVLAPVRHRLAEDDALLCEWVESARRVGRACAALDIAELIWAVC